MIERFCLCDGLKDCLGHLHFSNFDLCDLDEFN